MGELKISWECYGEDENAMRSCLGIVYYNSLHKGWFMIPYLDYKSLYINEEIGPFQSCKKAKDGMLHLYQQVSRFIERLLYRNNIKIRKVPYVDGSQNADK